MFLNEKDDEVNNKLIITDLGKNVYDDDNEDSKTNCFSKNTSDDKNEFDIEAAPSYITSLIIEKKNNNNCDCIEMDKLLLIHCYFYFKSNIKDYYKVSYKKICKMNYNRIKQNSKKYDTFTNKYHYNFKNLFDYTKEVKDQLNERNKKRINFELILRFKNENLKDLFDKQEKYFPKFNISSKFKFLYFDNQGKIIYKKKYEHKNIFDEKTRLTKINIILTEIENILDEIYENENNNNNKKEALLEKKIIPEKVEINIINNSKLNIISFIKEIGKHDYTVQMIKQFQCGKFVSCGFDGYLNLYDENFDNIYRIQVIDNWIYSISEIPNTKNEFLVCCPEKVFLVLITDNKLEVQNKRLIHKNSIIKYCFSTKDNELILCGNNFLTRYEGIKSDKENNDILVINKMHATNGIKITNNIISVVSNKVLNKRNKEEDILKIINTNNNNELYQEEHSFNVNPNSLLLINTNIDLNNRDNEGQKRKKKSKKNKNRNIQKNNNNEKAKLLICACTKYYDDQKNGILVLCPNGKKIDDNFYDTGDFEVFCFCLLKNHIDDNIIIDTNYLLVGGYDNNLNQGLIKLYEIVYNGIIELTKLKFIRNLHNSSLLKSQLNCIIQSTEKGNIIVTSWDGTVNLFSRPNFESLKLEN